MEVFIFSSIDHWGNKNIDVYSSFEHALLDAVELFKDYGVMEDYIEHQQINLKSKSAYLGLNTYDTSLYIEIFKREVK